MLDQTSSPDDIGAGTEEIVTKHARLVPHPYLSAKGMEILEDVAAWLENGAPERGEIKGFYMGDWIVESAVGKRGCGTYCCIAGAVVAFNGKCDSHRVAKNAVKLLTGKHYLTDEVGAVFDNIFVPQGVAYGNAGEVLSPYSDNPAWAARVVRKFIATGEVDWAGTAVA